MWSSGRSEAALEAALPAPIEIRPIRSARRLRLRFDEARGVLKLTCPWRTSRRAALAWALDQRDWIEAQLARAEPGEPFVPGAIIPIEGARRAAGVGRSRAAHAAARRQASFAAAGPRRGFARRIEPFSSACALDTMAREVAEFAAAAGVSRARGQHRRCRDALGQLLVAGPDPPELAADPRAARSAPLRRRARGRAPRPPQPRAGVQGARGAAVRVRRCAEAKAALRRVGPRLRRIGRRR